MCVHPPMRRYQKLYSDFKSDKYGWRMVLLARKLLLVSTTVMFNQLPLFQVWLGCVCVAFHTPLYTPTPHPPLHT